MAAGAGNADDIPSRRAVAARPVSPALPLALILGLLLAGQPAPAAALEVKIEGEQMSADFGAVPIADVLAAVAQQTGARLAIRGELGTARPQAFSRIPLTEALPRVVQPNGVILEFAPGGDRGGGRRLAVIRAVAPGSPGVAPGLASAGEGGSGVIPAGRPDARRGMPQGFWDYANEDVALPEMGERINTLNRTARTRGPAITAALVYVLRSDPEAPVRRAALGLLAGLPGDDGRLAITEAVADADPEMRMDALRALAANPRGKPVPLLAQTAKGDADPAVRAAAIGLLSRQDGDLARAVLEGARADADAQVREAAQQVLRR